MSKIHAIAQSSNDAPLSKPDTANPFIGATHGETMECVAFGLDYLALASASLVSLTESEATGLSMLLNTLSSALTFDANQEELAS